MLAQENLLPLSRLPRVWTSAFTNKEFPDFSKKMVCQGTPEQTRQIKKDTIKTEIRPTCTYKLETPIVEPFEVKYQPYEEKEMEVKHRDLPETKGFHDTRKSKAYFQQVAEKAFEHYYNLKKE
jgi:hypothetical protein